MPIEKESITIDQCPLCPRRHTYSLEVDVSYVVGLVTMNSQPTPVTYTRFFHCPDKDDDFEADVVLYQTPNRRIKSVRVIGLVSG
jgi:hypothetical protein